MELSLIKFYHSEPVVENPPYRRVGLTIESVNYGVFYVKTGTTHEVLKVNKKQPGVHFTDHEYGGYSFCVSSDHRDAIAHANLIPHVYEYLFHSGGNGEYFKFKPSEKQDYTLMNPYSVLGIDKAFFSNNFDLVLNSTGELAFLCASFYSIDHFRHLEAMLFNHFKCLAVDLKVSDMRNPTSGAVAGILPIVSIENRIYPTPFYRKHLPKVLESYRNSLESIYRSKVVPLPSVI